MTHNAEFTLWFTGMSGAGKSTLAAAIRDESRALGHRVEVLDGDEVRQNLSKGRSGRASLPGAIQSRSENHASRLLKTACRPTRMGEYYREREG